VRPLRRCPALVLAFLAWSVARPLSATPADEDYSDYEQETLDLVLEGRGGTLDSQPAGKRIVAIEVEVLDVIEQRDPAPNFLNWFHANSRDYVIRRELLFEKGEGYDQQLAQESERNIRALRQQSLVIIAPLATGESDTVKVLVIAKDIWSLRLNSDYRIQGGALEYLLLQPSEENLVGTHRRVLAQFVYEPDTLAIGGKIYEPRIAGSRTLAAVDGNVIVNHATGEVEGSFGDVQYGLPLYSTRQKWSWGAVASWHSEVSRRFIGTTQATFDRDPADDVDDGIPYQWDSEVIAGRFSATRSYGSNVKSDISFGAEAERSVFRTADLSAYDPAAVDAFVDSELPISDTRNGPFVQYHMYLNSFASLLDVETMSLQESYVLGPELYLRFYPVAEVFGSTRNFFGYRATLAYTAKVGDGLGRVYGSGTLEAEPTGESIYDSLMQTGWRFVSPRFVIGRLVHDGTLAYRRHNFSNGFVSLGGDTRLRGYASGLFIGDHLLASNLEFRSRALSLWTVQVGGALFYDVGDAFDSFGQLRVKQGAGFGLRVLFPQLERTVMRVDWGFALTEDRCLRADQSFACNPGLPTSPFDGLILTFRQAFAVPRPTSAGVQITSK
jgi:hypothetical protein